MPNRLSDAAQTERDAGKMPPSSPVEPETLGQSYDAAQAARNVLKAALKWDLAHAHFDEPDGGTFEDYERLTRTETALRQAVQAYAAIRLEADV